MRSEILADTLAPLPLEWLTGTARNKPEIQQPKLDTPGAQHRSLRWLRGKDFCNSVFLLRSVYSDITRALPSLLD